MSDPKRILVVDDDPLVLESVSRLLKSQGYQIIAVESGTKAIELVKEQDSDLVISDIRMPEIDGVETVQIIQAHYDHHGKSCAFMFMDGLCQR